MPVSKLFFSIAAIAVLAACSSSDPQPTPGATPTPTALPKTIPPEFQGRWGLTAEDCTAEAGTAEGFLTVKPDTLELYQSRGTIEDVSEAVAGRFRGTFKITGEGETRTVDEVFDLHNGGQLLVRREFGEGASPMPLNYMKCG
jgi:hypothetical protein